MLMASSYCPISRLIMADPSSSKIRGSLNCHGIKVKGREKYQQVLIFNLSDVFFPERFGRFSSKFIMAVDP